jgi:hypothetical protein
MHPMRWVVSSDRPNDHPGVSRMPANADTGVSASPLAQWDCVAPRGGPGHAPWMASRPQRGGSIDWRFMPRKPIAQKHVRERQVVSFGAHCR